VIKDENLKDPIGFLPTAMSNGDIQKVINIRNNRGGTRFYAPKAKRPPPPRISMPKYCCE
jgi:hypothetical protein